MNNGAPGRRDIQALCVFLLAAALPFLSLVGHPGAALADPLSELPVKLWAFETFARVGLLVGDVTTIGYPHPGPLNDPDPVGVLVTGLLRPLVGRIGAYNLLVWLQLTANMVATYALALTVNRSRSASAVAAVAFGLTPLTLMYCVTGAVTDMLNLWPYLLAIRSTLLAVHRPGWRDGAAAGAWLALGFVACPYNFLVFSVLAIPTVPFLPALVRGGPSLVVTPGPGAKQLGRGLLTLALVGGLGVGSVAWRIHTMMESEDSQMSTASVDYTRHHAPYTFLQPGHVDRYTAYLADYVAVGKSALIQRDAGSRYYRAFSPGLSLIGLTLVGLALSRRRLVAAYWATAGAFVIVASTGPFLPVTRMIAADTPVNVVWLGLHLYWPGAELLLEPFRYGLPAALCLAMGASIGLVALRRRLGGWVYPAALALWMAETFWVSPLPTPLPAAALSVPSGYARLDEVLPPGPIIDLPYFDHGSERFERTHYLHQLIHGRPIPDEVMGFVPRYLKQNQLTAELLFLENAVGRARVEVTARDRIEADVRTLAADGFVGIVLNPAAYRDDDLIGVEQRLQKYLGSPVKLGGLRVYALTGHPD